MHINSTGFPNNGKFIFRLGDALKISNQLQSISQSEAQQILLAWFTTAISENFSECKILLLDAIRFMTANHKALSIVPQLLRDFHDYQEKKQKEKTRQTFSQKDDNDNDDDHTMEKSNRKITLFSIPDQVIETVILEFLSLEEIAKTWIRCCKFTYLRGFNVNHVKLEKRSSAIWHIFPLNISARIIPNQSVNFQYFVDILTSFKDSDMIVIDSERFKTSIDYYSKSLGSDMVQSKLKSVDGKFQKIRKLSIYNHEFNDNNNQQIIKMIKMDQVKELRFIEEYGLAPVDSICQDIMHFIKECTQLQTLLICHPVDHSPTLTLSSLIPSQNDIAHYRDEIFKHMAKNQLKQLILIEIPCALLYHTLQNIQSDQITHLSVSLLDVDNIHVIDHQLYTITDAINNKYSKMKELCLLCGAIDNNRWIKEIFKQISVIEKIELTALQNDNLLKFIKYMTNNVDKYAYLKYLSIGLCNKSYDGVFEFLSYDAIFVEIVKFLEMHSKNHDEIMIQIHTDWGGYDSEQDPQTTNSTISTLLQMIANILHEIKHNTKIHYQHYLVGVIPPKYCTKASIPIEWDMYEVFSPNKNRDFAIIPEKDKDQDDDELLFYQFIIRPKCNRTETYKQMPGYYYPKYSIY